MGCKNIHKLLTAMQHQPESLFHVTYTVDIKKKLLYGQTLCGKHQTSPVNLNLSMLIVCIYSIHVPGWLQKWLNLITAPGSVSNQPGSVTWLATKYLKTVSWRNHTEKLTTWWPQNISFWPKINIPSSYFTILMLNCLKKTLNLQFDSYVTAVRFLT